jgi:hypothetical protein
MLRSILTLTARHFFRNLYFSAITLGSLIIGISVVVLLFLWDRYEFGYDRQDPDAGRVYVVLNNEQIEGEIQTGEEFNIPLADFLAHELPEVEATARIDNSGQQFTVGETSLREDGIYSDSTFFRIFPTTFIEGSTEKPLSGTRTIAISDVLAKRLFRDTPALGKYVMLDGNRGFVVSAVYKEYPRNNSLYPVEALKWE